MYISACTSGKFRYEKLNKISFYKTLGDIMKSVQIAFAVLLLMNLAYSDLDNNVAIKSTFIDLRSSGNTCDGDANKGDFVSIIGTNGKTYYTKNDATGKNILSIGLTAISTGLLVQIGYTPNSTSCPSYVNRIDYIIMNP
jgi:hypothetical protein